MVEFSGLNQLFWILPQDCISFETLKLMKIETQQFSTPAFLQEIMEDHPFSQMSLKFSDAEPGIQKPNVWGLVVVI